MNGHKCLKWEIGSSMNLLKETVQDIKESGHTIKDVAFIGSDDGEYGCTWEEFKLLADFDYNWGFGSQKVARDLIVVFKDGATMWRHEYDGSEEWKYSRHITIPSTTKKITALHHYECMWARLKEIEQENSK